MARATATAPPSGLGLQRIRLLEGLPAESLERLAANCSWRRFTAGQVLLRRDAPVGGVLLIVQGQVRIDIYTAAGRQVAFRDLGEGDIVGEIAAIDGGRHSADVTALTQGLAAAIAPAAFRRLLAEHDEVGDRFMQHLVQLIRLLSDKVVELSTLGVRNRIHGEILRLARATATDGGACVISPAPRHADIAARISTTREQVTRELSALSRAGLLEKTAQGLVVTDIGRLARSVDEAMLQA
ncbi:Crp/Fnr family transcriptional regulator [Caenimonas sedimenti]|uniref:Crp/Fnr family transcriptional regulator n=1 Tax=Caenimonas sedimenti TaxID=2596921 RepID=A0A562ZQ03_9BURK|nr:Crp/Fnr family transcriptional regulator [Caenimonas sedimenti]TWO70660.1 Crp/Fnr family transcriptional regulator [Caenimonas sedimenti]